MPALTRAKCRRIQTSMGVFRTNKALERLEDRLWQLERLVTELQSANKTLGLEWEELYDKVRHQMARMSKRKPIDTPALGDPQDPNNDNSQFPESDPISRSIMLRRAGQGIRK